MPRTLTLDLGAEQRRELETVRDHHALPHMREKAAALLKIAAGQNGLSVAQHGLLRRRNSDTVYRWVARYQAEGVAGLLIRPGRGRKPPNEGASPLFPPTYPGNRQAKEALLVVLHTPPEAYGYRQSRWTLAALRDACPWLHLGSVGGLCQLLERLDIRHKRPRAYLHSPDPNYAAKVAYLQECWQRLLVEPERYVLLYLDEFAFERQPTLACAYEARGRPSPLARFSYRSNTQCRGLGALNALSGAVLYCQRSHITTSVLSAFYATITTAYPQAEVIYVAQDNWPVHVHPDGVARLQPQTSPFWPRVPDNWPCEPSRRAVRDTLPIQLVFLPTYAPWLNPIEKLWRWVRQEVLHLHRLSDAWEQLKQRVADFIAQFAYPSEALLRYVGLLPY